jgi:hypothetical protein
MSPKLARLGPAGMSAIRSLSRVKRTYARPSCIDANDLGCVKTVT